MTSNIQNNLGACIEAGRMKKGLSKRTLAKQLGVSRNTLDNYVKGKSIPDIEIVQKLEQILEISLLRELSDYPEQTEIGQVMQDFAYTVSNAMTPEEQEIVGACFNVITRHIDRKE